MPPGRWQGAEAGIRPAAQMRTPLLALLLVASTAAAEPSFPPEELRTRWLPWIADNTSLEFDPATVRLPSIHTSPIPTIRTLSGNAKAIATYVARSHAVHLKACNMATLVCQSILIHELVHAMQFITGGWSPFCRSQLERQAYLAQALYLEQGEVDSDTVQLYRDHAASYHGCSGQNSDAGTS